MINPDPISIIIPVLNRENLICRCLDSVRNQTYRPIRLIVVDNNSSDNTIKNIEEWKEKYEADDFSITILSEATPGAAAARNCGLKEVNSDRVLFFDSDDVMLSDLVTTVMEEFRKKPKLDLVYWRTAFVNDKEEVIPRKFAYTNLIQRHIYNTILPTQAYAVRTEFLRQAGAWNENLLVWNDWELGLRLLLNEPNMKGIFRTLVHIYPQAESITGTNFHSKAGKWELAMEAMEKDSELAHDSLKKRILSMLTYRKVILAAHYAAEGCDKLGKDLLEKAIHEASLPAWRIKLLRIIYAYTKAGGRAAYLLW